MTNKQLIQSLTYKITMLSDTLRELNKQVKETNKEMLDLEDTRVKLLAGNKEQQLELKL